VLPLCKIFQKLFNKMTAYESCSTCYKDIIALHRLVSVHQEECIWLLQLLLIKIERAPEFAPGNASDYTCVSWNCCDGVFSPVGEHGGDFASVSQGVDSILSALTSLW